MEQSHSVNAQMTSGAAWMVLFKVLDRAIGFIGIVVLARLLVPADFGLMTLAASLIAMLEVLGAFGLDTALIQRADASSQHYNAAWTFNALFGIGTGVLTAALAVPVAALYGDQRLVPVMLVLALGRAIGGFENVGVVKFRKELRFEREFRYLIAKRAFTSLVVTLPAALLLRSYWALLIGNITGTCLAVALSYAMHPFRPRFSLRTLRELMHFSKWLFMSNAVETLYLRFFDAIVGRFAGASGLGVLSVARDLARMPYEFAAPIHRAVFPGYVQLASDRALLRRSYVRVTGILTLVMLPAGVGLCVVAEPVVYVLLGAQWSSAIVVVQILAINGALSLFMATAHYASLAVGMARASNLVLVVHLLVALPFLWWLLPALGIAGAAWSLLLGSIVSLPFNLLLLSSAMQLRWRDLWRVCWRPLAASCVMLAAIVLLREAWPMPTAASARIFYLAIVCTTGAIVYGATIWALWRTRGDTDSAEAWLFDRVRGWHGTRSGALRVRPR
ncbi:MAG TPA: lipopolysaccharide biosynthesis protein [Casimicrobiaceae bacterium]|nr:lipopolysaccharide biosynthesis protein [Casimicrobiaceae bacterium]